MGLALTAAWLRTFLSRHGDLAHAIRSAEQRHGHLAHARRAARQWGRQPHRRPREGEGEWSEHEHCAEWVLRGALGAFAERT